MNDQSGSNSKNGLSPEDWQTLVDLTAELLRAIDESLAEENLDFAAAFEKACLESAEDFPFLHPAAGEFIYQNGQIKMISATNARMFAAAVNEVLRRIFAKLGAAPQFAEIHRRIVQKILALIDARRTLYDRFSITPQLERILGA